jgi:hypothetical protein
MSRASRDNKDAHSQKKKQQKEKEKPRRTDPRRNCNGKLAMLFALPGGEHT